jgi:cyclase
VTNSVSVPVLACVGAGNVQDFVVAVRDGGASAGAAGSMFVFYGVHKAVLVNFPAESVLRDQFFAVCQKTSSIQPPDPA